MDKEDRLPPDGRELLVTYLPLIERVLAFACRRNHLNEADAEEFSSIVKLKLVENDYAILRKFEGRSKFSTFITVVIQRLLLDHRIHRFGKWHASAEALRLGELAVQLERLIYRDGRSLDDALPLLAAHHPGVTRPLAEELLTRLPVRPPRRRSVDVEEAESVSASGAESVEEDAFRADRQRTSERISVAMRELINRLPGDDRLILQLRFQSGLTVAQVSRALQLDQKLLYRRIDQRIRELRKGLESAGVPPRDALDLIGSSVVELDFGLGNNPSRPSTESKGVTRAARDETSP